MSENKLITHEQYKLALEEKLRLEKHLEHLTRITRAYMYQWEADRVKHRKVMATIDDLKQNKS